MDINSRKAVYAEVERIREEIDQAFCAWRCQDISVGQERPTVGDLIDAIEDCIHPLTAVESKVTHVRPVGEAR